MAASVTSQSLICHERSASVEVSALIVATALSCTHSSLCNLLLIHLIAEGGLHAWLQEGQSSAAACSTSYSEAHGRLQMDSGAMHTTTVSVHRPIDPYRFNMFMSDLLAERGSDIKQMHGILSIQVRNCDRVTPPPCHISATPQMFM